MKKQKLSWGLLSTARINRAVIPHLQSSSRNVLSAVASRNLAAAHAYAREKGIPRALGTYEALLEDPEIDVIYIPLPNHLHAEWSIKALEAGKHVLCEKPIALSLEEMDAMIAAAHRSACVLEEAFMYRHHAQTKAVQQIVSSGALGEIQLLRGQFSFSMRDENNIRWDPAMGGGSLWDVGCYPVSFARAVVDQAPVEVFGWQIDRNGVDSTFSGLVHFSGGAILHFDCSFNAPYRTEMEIIGSKASITIPMPFKPNSESTLLLNTNDEQIEKIEVHGNPLYLDEVEELASVILDGTAPTISLEDSRTNTSVLVALYRSAKENRPVRLSDIEYSSLH